ncbi:MAG: UrcA family protein [Phenylobacterium sp.]
MSNVTNTIAGFASLLLAAVPLATIATGAYAAPGQVRVQVGDLDLNSAPGLAAFHQRATTASLRFCRKQTAGETIRINSMKPCMAGVQAELQRKLVDAQTAQYASR